MALRKRKKEDKQTKVTTTAAAAADKPARSNLMAMFLMMLMVFVVGAGMVIGYFKFIDPGSDSDSANAKPTKEITMSSMELGDMVVNLADRNGNHFLKTKIVIEYPEDKKTAELVQEKKSHIIEAVLLALRKKTVDEIKPPEATEKLKQELVTAINNRLEEEVIERVIFTQYIVQ
ncbi:flagellar basal body-associated FliL family protein [Desulfoscipio sp. XC116]|uniref:flagellar basal body-associated FliL family protein n=1 Tax=Desulfoscipio sp. XC116 TaxID=3144975 RepID=UPI00325A6C89